MKILYAIQGTGNGHLTRAISIVPHLMKHANVDVLLSGIQADISLPFPVKYRYHGLSFIFGKRGGINFWATYRKNQLRRFFQEVKSLDVSSYDLVISDFEPISAWACQQAHKPCIGLSNQATLLTEGTPKPAREDAVGRLILRHYAPTTTSYGFHYMRYNNNIYTPLIRDEIRKAEVTEEDHVTVYLPAYSDAAILKALHKFPNTDFEVFSKHTRRKYYRKNVMVRPVESGPFLKSFVHCKGVVCAAGFGTTTEALFLGKKLLVVPQKSQFEQQCNAKALADLGVSVMRSLHSKHLSAMANWLQHGEAVHLNYPDITDELVGTILSQHGQQEAAAIRSIQGDQVYSQPA